MDSKTIKAFNRFRPINQYILKRVFFLSFSGSQYKPGFRIPGTRTSRIFWFSPAPSQVVALPLMGVRSNNKGNQPHKRIYYHRTALIHSCPPNFSPSTLLFTTYIVSFISAYLQAKALLIQSKQSKFRLLQFLSLFLIFQDHRSSSILFMCPNYPNTFNMYLLCKCSLIFMILFTSV